MIVTRRRRKKFPFRRLILSLVIVLVLVFVVLWTPTRNAIANGPLAPLWKSSATAMAPMAAPFHFAAQNRVITDLKHQIVELQSQLAVAKAKVGTSSNQVSSLKSQIAQLQAQAVSARANIVGARPQRMVASNGGAGVPTATIQGAAQANDLTAGATPDQRRTAADWANMQPANAAKVVQKLPIAYDARVMALMSPDDAGAILDALPAAFAAQLTQENPELRH